MNQARIAEIAAEFIPFLKGDNDAIAADPRRWHEEMTSWSAEEAAAVVAALINKAVNESIEDCAKACDERAVFWGRDPIDGEEHVYGYRQEESEWCAEAIRKLKSFPA